MCIDVINMFDYCLMFRMLFLCPQGDTPTSLNILNQGINGQKFGFDKDEECSTCGELGAEKKCSACKMVRFFEGLEIISWGLILFKSLS